MPERHAAAAVVHRGDEVLVTRRPEDGLLGGLWDFPGVSIPRAPREGPERSAARRLLRERVADELGLDVSVGRRMRAVRHAFSHFRLTLVVHEARWRAGELADDGSGLWVPPGRLGELAFPAYCRSVLTDLRASERG